MFNKSLHSFEFGCRKRSESAWIKILFLIASFKEDDKDILMNYEWNTLFDYQTIIAYENVISMFLAI